MSQLVLAIIAFVLFSVITDFLEGMKKKRNQQTPPARPNSTVGANPKEPDAARRRAAVAAEPQKSGRRDERRLAAPHSVPGGIAAGPGIQAERAQDAKSGREAQILKPTDIHSEVLLNAVAYAQILQPPKAYQYMATRSCRGEWNNQK